MDMLKTEFIRKITRGSKNDIPDSISLQIPFMPQPRSTPLTEEDKTKQEEEKKKRLQEERDRSAWKQMFEETQNVWYGNDTPQQQQEYLIDESFNISHEEGYENILGAGLIG